MVGRETPNHARMGHNRAKDHSQDLAESTQSVHFTIEDGIVDFLTHKVDPAF